MWLAVLTVLLVAADQATKYAAVYWLKDQPAFTLWTGVFELRYCENSGVAFSMLENQRWIFIPVTLLVILLMFVLLLRSEWRTHWCFRLSACLIMAGGIGNLIDRILYGYVVDFLYFRLINFPIFNFADCCVTVGAVLLFVFFLFLWKDTEQKPLKALMFGIDAGPAAPAETEEAEERTEDPS